MIRTYSDEEVEKLAKYSSIPIINGLTDLEHPCQVLADLMTIREYKNILDGLNIAYVGDGNNMSHSLLVGCLKLGMNFSLACPNEYMSKDEYIALGKELATKENVSFNVYNDPALAVKNADVVITDSWTSMGHESEAEARKKAFEGFQINNELLKNANENVMVLHCLPAHKDEEISTEVFEEHSAEIFDETENRLHAQKAILVKLMKNK